MKSLKADLSKKRLNNISLSYNCIQTILGGLLGDSSLKIQKGYKNARLQIRHTHSQKEYLVWKAEKLDEIATTKNQIQKPDGYSKNEKISFLSRALPELTLIHTVVSQNNVLRIQRNWLNHLDELALLIWWLDDGSIISNGRKGVFCTNNFDYCSHKILKKYLMVVWNIYSTIGNLYPPKKSLFCPSKSTLLLFKEGKPMSVDNTFSNYKDQVVSLNHQERVYTKQMYHRLYLNNTELRKLFDLIMPLLETPSMVKKFALKYKNSDDQQRWISKMKSAMPKFHKEIDTLYSPNTFV